MAKIMPANWAADSRKETPMKTEFVASRSEVQERCVATLRFAMKEMRDDQEIHVTIAVVEKGALGIIGAPVASPTATADLAAIAALFADTAKYLGVKSKVQLSKKLGIARSLLSDIPNGLRPLTNEVVEQFVGGLPKQLAARFRALAVPSRRGVSY